MILTELATASDTFFFSQPLSFSWTSCACNSTQKTHIMMVYNKKKNLFFFKIISSGFLYLPAAGRRSCRCQWPTQAHRRARPCSSPSHCLWKRRVIRLEFRKMSDFLHTLACANFPWREHSDSLMNLCHVPAMTLVWLKTTFSVMPPSLSSSFSPMQAMTPRPDSRAWAVFWPMS